MVETGVTASEAVVPETVKSPASTFRTSSSKVTRQVRVSAAVGETDGEWRAIEETRGEVVSTVPSSSFTVTVALDGLPWA